MPSVTKLRRELLQKFKGWSVVAQGELDQRGDDFDSDLSGHDPYMEFLDAKDEQFMVATTLRPPGNLEKNFSKLGDGERKQLTVESGMAKIRYREALVQEYKEILDIEHLPFEFQLSGKAAKELRSDFVERAANASELSPPNNKRMWGTLCREELEAAKKLKGVLDELVEVACCGPDLASIYEERDYDDFAYTCQHAAKALTPFLPLCSDEQLGRLAKLLGHSDGGAEDVANYSEEMFSAWDYSFECSWVWDILLETVANCTRQKEDDIIERLIPVLEQCEPWGGQMHDEQVLACAAALAFDNFGLATIQAESMQGDDEFEGRACTNGSLFCELMRLQAADADNIVMKKLALEYGQDRTYPLTACRSDAIDLFTAGGYLEWLAALKLPASNRQRIDTAKACAEMTIDREYAHKIIPKQREKVETWLRDTECLKVPEAVAKEVLAGRRRAAFDDAVNALVEMEKVTAGAIRKHLAEYQQACKQLEDASQSSPAGTKRKESGASGSGASTSGNATVPPENTTPPETRGKVERVCEHCREPAKDGAKLKKCSKCNKARYCGAECQKLAWRAGHKEACRGYTAQITF